MNSPCSEVLPLIDALVARAVAVTVALGITAPVKSVTVPEIDPEPIRAALAARSGRSAVEAERFKRLEAWRERLVLEGVAQLDELERWRPGLDRTEWMRMISAAQSERDRGGKGTAGRELFRALRALFEADVTR